MYKVLKGLKSGPVYPVDDYPFPDMEVGDCFEVPVDPNTQRSHDKAEDHLFMTALAYGRPLGKKFRVEQDLGKGVSRVWLYEVETNKEG